MNVHIISHYHKDTLVKRASYKINDLLKRYENNQILLLLSGGSALELLNDIKEEVFKKNVTVTVLDERYTFDPQINNFFLIGWVGSLNPR